MPKIRLSKLKSIIFTNENISMIVIFSILLLISGLFYYFSPSKINVYYLLNSDCEAVIINKIDLANSDILLIKYDHKIKSFEVPFSLNHLKRQIELYCENDTITYS
ncbi:MAG TPA: hypothetical protein PLX15_04915 [Candidatus Woesearchaeota archaeon]|nr:hypothetical protein [Candidatus Woesearchaeota archaeon]